jgi:hypothetical protein
VFQTWLDQTYQALQCILNEQWNHNRVFKQPLKDLGNSSFAILVDESRDIFVKEQLAIVLRYVDKRGHVIELF